MSLDKSSFVVEAASNDGYLLQHFYQKNIPCLGVEPTNCANIASSKGINTLKTFFNTETSQMIIEQYSKADLFIGNNVLAHVPNLDNFVKAIKNILKTDGVATLEFPHLLNMIKYYQFDTIYHEHYSYISYIAILKTLNRHQLKAFKIEHIDTHGGSLRLYLCHTASSRNICPSVKEVMDLEIQYGLNNIKTFRNFQIQVNDICLKFMQFIVTEKLKGKQIWAFGAAAKGNTFLNYCGIKSNLIEAVIDETPSKIGRLMPGSKIPIVDISALQHNKPDYIIILPWNWSNIIIKKLNFVSSWGAKLIIALPRTKIIELNNEEK